MAPSVTWADDEKYDLQMDMDQENQARDKYRLERDNEMFPDEVDTPETMPARLRFARYVFVVEAALQIRNENYENLMSIFSIHCFLFKLLAWTMNLLDHPTRFHFHIVSE